MKDLLYDKTSPEDIERYSKTLLGKTFYDVLAEENLTQEEIEALKKYYDNPRSKGGLGNLLEKYFFYYKPNSDSEPDFLEAGVELKVTPYEITKKNKIKAGERLVIGMIGNKEPIETDFFKSHLLYKMRILLLIFYLREKGKPRTSYRIDYVKLFSIISKICKEDLKIIMEDYKKITDKIIAGKAHELSEGDTKYLGACTKGSTANKSLQPQYYNKNILAKRRAFSLKQGYMTFILNHYILGNEITYDSALNIDELNKSNFDDEILNRIKKYVGKTEDELCKIFGINKRIKQKNNLLVCRMVGVKTDRVAEFEKANIKIKTIRVKKNGKPKESMSFPTLKIKEFIEEDFEDSKLYDYFESTRFLFVVFKEQENGEYILKGSKFWNMPMEDLENIGQKEWNMYKNKFIDGVNFTIEEQKNKIIIKNDLQKSKETEMFHLRPHAANSAYIINDKKYGIGGYSDMDELPNGDKMTKQSFWLNNSYIAKIIKNL